jgi:hypothetical protein
MASAEIADLHRGAEQHELKRIEVPRPDPVHDRGRIGGRRNEAVDDVNAYVQLVGINPGTDLREHLNVFHPVTL